MGKLIKYISILLIVVLVLSACGKSSNKDEGVKDATKTETSKHKGGTLNVALTAPPSGVYSSLLNSTHADSVVEGYFNESLLATDKKIRPKAYIASWKDIEPAKKIEFKIKKAIKWHDGNELKIDDWIYSIEVLANKDYEGAYYPSVENIQGAKDYHEGKTDHISGLKKIDDYTMQVTFDKKQENYLTGFITGHLLSKKYLSDVPIKDLAKSDKIRKYPIGIGPYKVKKIVPGEAVQLVKKVLSAPSLDYGLIGFVSHDYDKKANKTGKVRPKYEDKELRKAMLYAIDREKWIKAFFNGYASEINSFVPSMHWIAANPKDLNDYKYDPEKAKKILDKLGYKDRDGDGFREDPKGNKFEINFKHYSGSNPTFEPRTAAIKDFWEKVGLKTNVKLVEFGKYNEDLANASKDMEVYFRSWAGGTDPDPSDLYHTDRPQNEMRTVLPKSDQYLDDALDFEKVGIDEKKRKDIYVKWQKYMNDELPGLPMFQGKSITIVNDKVRNLDIEIGTDQSLYNLTKEA
ncbi:TPA: ABC transporter substrate-binding protein [Staphylococcus aureus]|nr:ABC transporter substrate-binding protein [Staphylococcus aureus]